MRDRFFRRFFSFVSSTMNRDITCLTCVVVIYVNTGMKVLTHDKGIGIMVYGEWMEDVMRRSKYLMKIRERRETSDPEKKVFVAWSSSSTGTFIKQKETWCRFG